MLMALSASPCSLIVTKANPLDSPLFRSVINSAATTFPAWANKSFNSSWVVDLDKFPTYNLASMQNTAFYPNGHMSGLMTGIRKPTNPLIGLAAVLPHKSGSLILVGWLNNPGGDLIVFHRHLFLDRYASRPGINGC